MLRQSFFPSPERNRIAGVGARLTTRKILGGGESVAIVILRFEIPIYAIIGHLHRAVIIGRAQARSVGTFSSRLVESPDAEWVGELKNRYVRKWESQPFHPPFSSSRSTSSSYLPFGSFMLLASRSAVIRPISPFFFTPLNSAGRRNSRILEKRGNETKRKGVRIYREDTLRWFVNFARELRFKKKRDGPKRLYLVFR